VPELISHADLEIAVHHLIGLEPRFENIVRHHGIPSLRLVPAGLESLLRIVTDQLISLKAGEAIWKRVAQRLSPFDPAEIMDIGEQELRNLGLSGAKARTFLAAAHSAQSGILDANNLVHLPDAQILSALREIAGIGPWTANIYLLSALGRTDAWPCEDLALRVAVQDLFKLESRPCPKQMMKLAEPWQPYRAVAARLLWSHYRGLKGMSQRTI
jgi:DNA-3-methyladenine glycosylase II